MKSKEELKELAEALKCSLTSDRMGHTRVCTECPWHIREEIDPAISCYADTEIDGKAYWISCDCDRLVSEALEVIEEVIR